MKLNQLGILAFSMIGLSNVLSAVDDMQMRNVENRLHALEQRRGANGMINPPARPVVKDGTNLWIQSEALLMQPAEDGLAYALESASSVASSSNAVGKVRNVSYRWNWGFRVGIGYNSCHDGWDGIVNWTWFRSHQNNRDHLFTSIAQLTAPPVFMPFDASSGANPFRYSRGVSQFHLNLADLEIGREFFVSKWLMLRPHFGVRTGWISRMFGAEFANPVGSSSTMASVEVQKESRLRAGGARAGLNTQWGLGSGWSLFGESALSFLYGRQHLHSTQDVGNSSDVRVRTKDLHNRWTVVRPMVDSSTGVRWDHLFGKDDYRVRFQLGWEHHTLFGWDKEVGGGPIAQGDLSLNGFALQARLDF